MPSGHSYVSSRLGAAFSEAAWVNEQLGGVAFLAFVRELAEQVDNDWPGVLAKLEDVRGHLIRRNGMIANVTLDATNWGEFEPQLREFVSGAALGRRRARRLDARCAACTRGTDHSGPGQLCGQGGQSLRTGLRVRRLDQRDQQPGAHRLAVGQDPRPGRGLRRILQLQQTHRRLELPLLPRSQSAGHAGQLRPHRRLPAHPTTWATTS